MAVKHGYGKSAGTDALVFAYDTGDTTNSYKGQPTTNIMNTTDRAHGLAHPVGNRNFAGISVTNTHSYYYSAKRPHCLRLQCVATGSNGYKEFGQQSTGNVSGSTYVYSFDYKFVAPNDSGTGTMGTPFVYGDGYKTPSSTPTQTATNNTDIDLGDGWKRRRFKYTSTYTGNNYYRTNIHSNGYYFDVLLDNFQVEAGSHGTPFTPSSRSATKGLKDLTGNREFSLSNVSFDSNAKKQFDGTDDRIYIGQNLGLQNASFSVEAVIYWDGNSTDTFFGYTQSSEGQKSIHWRIYSSGLLRFDFYGNSINSAAGAISANTWTHLMVTYDYSSDTCICYKNGELLMQGSAGPYLGDDASSFGYVGAWSPSSQPFGGEIPVFKLYNKALTSGDALNNFMQYKRRFGI